MDLRAAPVDGRMLPTNGARLLPQPVRVDYVALANMMCIACMPGSPVPWSPAPGVQPIPVGMPDMSVMEREYAKQLDEKFGANAPPDQADKLAVVMLVAQFQRDYAEISKRWNERHAAAAEPAKPESLPEPGEDRAPEGMG